MKTQDLYRQDTGGNSTITRLQAELECNQSKLEHEPVSDSSLTYGDLRAISDAFLNHPPTPTPDLEGINAQLLEACKAALDGSSRRYVIETLTSAIERAELHRKIANPCCENCGRYLRQITPIEHRQDKPSGASTGETWSAKFVCDFCKAANQS